MKHQPPSVSLEETDASPQPQGIWEDLSHDEETLTGITSIVHPVHRPAAFTDFPRQVGRYAILREMARGGMGIILRGWDQEIGRPVAVKLLHDCFAGDERLIRRFNNEARITGRLEHPAVVPIHELGQIEDGRPYFTMRLMDCQTLTEMLANRPAGDAGQLAYLRIFEKLCEGMAFAHSKGIIHRDLKPSNVMVGAYGVVKIMDWGLGRQLRVPEPIEELCGASGMQAESVSVDEESTMSGTILGTPAYLPPEQARGEPVDERADVFSLGGILCQILLGTGPYPETGSSKLHQAREGNLGPILARLNECQAERPLVDIAKACLSPNPADRPNHAREVDSLIRDYLESDLRRAERDLVRFFDLSLDLFCIAGMEGKFRRVNRNFSTLLGYTEEELLSRPFTDLIHPDDLEATASAMSCLSAGLPVVRFTNRYRRKDGQLVYLEWMAGRDEKGQGPIYAVARDVTQSLLLWPDRAP
jgi:serine/threonine-protein kinase